MLDRRTGDPVRVGMHIVWLAVICDIDCVWIVCCCVLLFSWVFLCFFLFGPRCYIIFPYKELLINRHQTQRSNKDLKYLEEAQLNILVYLVNCIISLISIQNTNGVLDWLSASIPRQCKILTAVMASQQKDKSGTKPTVYFQTKVWIIYKILAQQCMMLEMCYHPK